MNAPLDADQRASLEAALSSVTLDDKYTLERGRAYMSGIQALVRLPMLQQERDKAAGLNTAGFISGYRGSPLGGLDLSLWKAKQHLAAHQVVFQPGVNEDLAATAVWGSQQVNLYPSARYDGVFSMWYGKGPGVDRSGDVFKHGNSAGSSKHGGVLVLAGDDHAAKSSTLAHQSEHMFKACGLPVLFPSNVQEYLDFGLHGWAMSRYSGLWAAMKCVTDVVESSASVDIDPHRTQIILPSDFAMPDGGLNIRWPDPPLVQEARLLDYKWYAALAYVRANKLDRVEIDSPHARFGIMTAGKAYLDVRQALTDLGLDDETCARIGIRLYKVGCVWPLEAQGAQAFARGLDEILVIEEKRQILEYAIKEELYNWPDTQRPRVYGKFDEKDGAGGEWSVPMGKWLLPAHYELSPAIIAKAIATRLDKFDLPSDVRARIATRIAVIEAKEKALARPRVEVERKPWFCSGCPHNTSTAVPEGSRAMAGIGCHYMTVWMDRSTTTFSQMGGEGVAWTGQAPFTNDKHVFANLGDGTYFHSGLLAIRAAIASKANITYKILYNDAVAMTGGQPVDGTLTVPQITLQLAAEGATKIVIVTDEPQKYQGAMQQLAAGVTIHHRDQLDDVQRELREIAGTTILIYDQTCATEKRRRRKRNAYPDPAKRVVINDAVCEGCGDCSVQSNCLSVEPLETEYGTKRQINQSTCNKDFSCLKGFCPSFVSVEGGQLRKPKAAGGVASDTLAPVPDPQVPAIGRPYGVLITGVGGTGVVTIGALLGMAAHLENKGVTVLDVTGLAQKGGAVMSHVQIANQPADIHATRIAMGEASLVIGCDAIVTASDECVSRMQGGRTRVVLNSAATPTAEFIKNPNWRFPGASAEADVRAGAGDDGVSAVDANRFALALLGDAIYTNPFMLGYAWQRGWIPLTHESLIRAIELNAVQVDKNRAAFEWGRRTAHDPAGVSKLANLQGRSEEATDTASSKIISLHTPKALDTLIDKRVQYLTAYQNDAYAARYRKLVDEVRAAETSLDSIDSQLPLTEAVAKNLHKLMAYKDEYEVARLYADPAFVEKLKANFEGDWKLKLYLAPPAFSKKDSHGHLVKKQYGPWVFSAMRVLAKFKFLRGTGLDVFGKTEERRTERALIGEYEALVRELVGSLSPQKRALAIELASLPDGIRGYGHVKENNLKGVRTKWTALLAKWRAPEGTGERHVA
ncbi:MULTISPECIES: indolepyruvate ferredoxin oxidoreductase family protein [Paraburkholderia]|uniref:Indolepyruvate ferredoxin oxidoreductase n=1 Tax=Paraburkholderia megapolitana TaxID=420953 RepID=A0A1I3SRC3_9BURK|nr:MULTISPECIES: indolepyruvate ferredoxin oxidoreductase family protein [Paraburkholderia]MCX4166137.1 indolepyruvate ferredoxin oxidoreductase family protein [Paraburkholderia megapolitana]MDN7161627.1 indolepyruvate ferredoxin oxidoreductase family protein [Paraburkholderia sp. CHISQ3]MDQ6498675.1 indolepyruvate ferredoxin oxidoreductase family protein [Paraburkholderia megapolitana]QDQ85634.1 indolepyruvate ferredoxin oxidoreductase family protein [Paraburkholderia megapolitana]SFJ59956.1 